ncbi:MAG: ZIP family metal transporter [Candidatus Pacebacteria bacterium]|nr:ZIP family metal transporter [Candidatus Paceibacterota bacterium]
MLLFILLATFSITLCIFIAVAFLYVKKEESLPAITIYLVSFSAGALIGGAFIHLLPEAAEKIHPEMLFIITLGAFVFFFLMEKILHWRHCHKGICEVHTLGHMNLFGDSLHNFIDGLVIASSFLVDIPLGIATTIAIALHEIPQEIGDFGVLLHAGFNRLKALIANYTVSLFVVLGGIAGYLVRTPLEHILPYLLPFAAGGFIYIAASDLMPEIRKEKHLGKSILNFFIFIAGIVLMILVRE